MLEHRLQGCYPFRASTRADREPNRSGTSRERARPFSRQINEMWNQKVARQAGEGLASSRNKEQ